MLNAFRRHRAGCKDHGKRTGPKCSSRPPCPIHYEGVTGQGVRIRPAKALIDPATGHGVRDWSRASEIIRDLETPQPVLTPPPPRVTIAEAIEHYQKLKASKSIDTRRKTRNLLAALRTFLQAPPRRYEFIDEVQFHDLTDMCSMWPGATPTKTRDLGILTAFTKYCYRAAFTPRNVGDGLFKQMAWPNHKTAKHPFEPAELEALWKAVPNLSDEYGRIGGAIAQQTEVFARIMRYTGMDVSTTMCLPKAHVRGNQILTYRLKNGEEVWTVVPEWVIEKLRAAPHDSSTYFFWSGHGSKHTRASKWFSRLRKLLNLAGLQHRTPHNFRHHFAIEHLLKGTPIEQVSRLLGHTNIQTTLRSYAAWIRARQEQLEQSQRNVWASDPEHLRQTQREKAGQQVVM